MRATLGVIGATVLLTLTAANLRAQSADENETIPALLASQAAEYAAPKPKTVIELQQFRRTVTGEIHTASGQSGTATLINLNPEINSWHLLQLDWGGKSPVESWHLENAIPAKQSLTLDPAYPFGVVISDGGQVIKCDLWQDRGTGVLVKARASGSSYASLCGGRLYLVNPTKGHMTNKEWVTDVLRDHVWQGEEIVGYVKSNFFRDAFLHTSIVQTAQAAELAPEGMAPGAPVEPLIDTTCQGKVVMAPALGIRTENALAPKFVIGRWYAAKDLPGVYVSALEPRAVSAELQNSLKGQSRPLDSVENRALAYLVAFDLERLDLGFSLGTEHPGVGWSERARSEVRSPALPGPDGIQRVAPLINTGLVNPQELPRVRATFTGGFKRHHGAFKYGRLAMQNGASHYGFIENGVVLSKLQPGLATLVVYRDGTVRLKTWSEDDNRDLGQIRHARQNGVPIVEQDSESGVAKPSSYVRDIGIGNWSGNEDGQLRTLRAGVCMQEQSGRRFLIYGYFSTATPAAMALVFKAYGCSYAMHLDMNALEHTYLAVYPQAADAKVGHLTTGMVELDKTENGRAVPRFIGYADNRDFFYLMDKAEVL